MTGVETSFVDLEKAAKDLTASVERVYRTGDALLGRTARERPYGILGTAFGVGFVLGGGLSSRLGSVLAGTLSRVLLAHVLESNSESLRTRREHRP